MRSGYINLEKSGLKNTKKKRRRKKEQTLISNVT